MCDRCPQGKRLGGRRHFSKSVLKRVVSPKTSYSICGADGGTAVDCHPRGGRSLELPHALFGEYSRDFCWGHSRQPRRLSAQVLACRCACSHADASVARSVTSLLRIKVWPRQAKDKYWFLGSPEVSLAILDIPY